LKEISPVVETVVKLVYVERDHGTYSTPSPWIHPLGAAKAQVYHTFGYKAGGWVSLFVLVAFLTWQIYVAFFTGQAYVPPTSVIPTAIPQKQFVEPTRPFSNITFFTPQEAQSLRQQENVINVAVLGDGYGARYMRDYAVVLDAPAWTKVSQVFGISAFTPSDSTFTITVNSVSYVLNKHQGFILANRPGTVYIVDEDNNIWECKFSDTLLVEVGRAQEVLDAVIPANQNLSLTLK
jgi:hypothetical protein